MQLKPFGLLMITAAVIATMAAAGCGSRSAATRTQGVSKQSAGATNAAVAGSPATVANNPAIPIGLRRTMPGFNGH